VKLVAGIWGLIARQTVISIWGRGGHEAGVRTQAAQSVLHYIEKAQRERRGIKSYRASAPQRVSLYWELLTVDRLYVAS
jgi:hypothetical protein